MKNMHQKLELRWHGKDDWENPEPRILVEKEVFQSEKKGIDDNLLIYGDNLLGLKALERNYSGKIKCIYIDPPYNTKSCFEHYNDNLEHSLWLNMMKERLVILHRLLREDGSIWISIDDSECHYLKVLCDEVFGRKNYLSQIAYERSGSAGIGLGGGFLVNTHEYILVYIKDAKKISINRSSVCKTFEKKDMQRYRKILVDEGRKRLVSSFRSKSNGEVVNIYHHLDYVIESISLKDFDKRLSKINEDYFNSFKKVFRTANPQKENSFQHELLSYMGKDLYSVEYTPSRGKNQGVKTRNFYVNKELVAWLKDTSLIGDNKIFKENKMTAFWSHSDIPKANLANEGGVEFRRGKKPEALLNRILSISTNPGDLVLDSFAGSGTTGAVAHKMGRRWIMIELGEHCHTHIIPRLEKVIDGEDPGGITPQVNWQGGGGFRYCEMAPSPLEKKSE